MPARHRQALRVAGLVVVLLYAWFASSVRTFTRPAEVLTFLPAFAVLVLTLRPAARSLAGPRPGGRYPRWEVLPWLLVLLAIVGWELVQLFQQPRHLHPTLSSITDHLLSTHPSRFLGYLVWLALGWLMVSDLRNRRRGGE